MSQLAAQAKAIANHYLSTRPDTGRVSELADSSKLAKFFEALADGAYVASAADYAGLGARTVHRWIADGEHDETSPQGQFRQAVKEAESAAECSIVKRVKLAAELPQFWAAGMTLLERRHPERWSKRQDDSQAPRVVVQIGAGVGDIKVGIITSTPLSPTNVNELGCGNPSQVEMLSPISGHYVNQPSVSVGALDDQANRQIAAGESGGAPTPVVALAVPSGLPAQNKGKRPTPRNKKKA